MKITKRHLKKVIREAIIREAQQPMTPEYVKSQMMGKGALRGDVFMDTAMNAIATGDLRTAANAVMDGLWIDDPPRGAEKELEDLLAGARTEDDVAAIGAEWGTRHFRTSPHIG